MADTWSPKQYEKFSDHRQRPFADLMSRVGAGNPEIVVDLGCGTGLADLDVGETVAPREDHRSRLLR